MKNFRERNSGSDLSCVHSWELLPHSSWIWFFIISKNTTLFIKPFGIKCALFEALEEYVTYVLKSREHLPTLPTSAHWWQTVLSTKPGFLPTVVSVSSFSLRLWKVTPDVMLNRDRNPRVCTASSYTLEGQFRHAISIYFLREAPVGLSSRNPLQQPVWYVTLY